MQVQILAPLSGLVVTYKQFQVYFLSSYSDQPFALHAHQSQQEGARATSCSHRNACLQGHNRNIFQRGQSHFSWFFSRCEMFFPGRKNSHFGEKKKKASLHFVMFPPSIFNFQPSLYWFSFFSSPFSLFSSLLFSRKVTRNFLVKSVRGHPDPPAVTPLVFYAYHMHWALAACSFSFTLAFHLPINNVSILACLFRNDQCRGI